MNLRELARWEHDNGPTTHFVQYDLTPESVCFDVGAYIGQYAQLMHDRYSCRVFCFEPVRAHFEQLVSRLQGRSGIQCFNVGLGPEDTNQIIAINADSSSLFCLSDRIELVTIRSIDAVMRETAVGQIDLIKINIEGGEYALLDHCLGTGLITRFRNIQVQFHDFFPDAVHRRNTIRDKLSLTHDITYDYEFVWENWKLRT
jgi:FkbM family methyltransferase